MNTSTLPGLQNATFFVIGKMFCLQGVQEHKYVYYENVSFCYMHALKQVGDVLHTLWENIWRNHHQKLEKVYVQPLQKFTS